MVINRIVESRFHDVYLPLREDLKVIFWSPHAAAPKREFYTGTIVRELHRRLGVGGIVGQVSRVIADLNRDRNHSPKGCKCEENYQPDAVDDFYKNLSRVLKELKLLNGEGKIKEKTLLVSVHGLSDNHGYGAIIGTLYGALCPLKFRDKLAEKFEILLKVAEVGLNNFPVVVDELYPGDPSLEDIRNRFGENLYIVQLELSKTFRTQYLEEIITALSMLALTFPKMVV